MRWEQDGSRYAWDEISAERAPDDGAFVITSFGSEPDAERVFEAIKAAMEFGMIRLRVTPQTKPTIETLSRDGRIKCVRAVGVQQEELGVVAIRTGAR